MKKRRILFVDLNLFFGGGQVYLECLARLLRDDMTLYAFCINPRLKKALQHLGVVAYGFDSEVRWGRPVHLVWALWTSLLVWARFDVDTIWVNGIPDMVVVPFGRLLGCRTLATRHLTLEIEAQGWRRRTLRRFAEYLYRICAIAADKIICVSSAVAEDLKTVVPKRKLAVIHNWRADLPDVTDRHPNLAGPLRLLYVGRLQHYKGAFLILDAMRKLKSNGGTRREVSLTIVGEGRHRAELEQQAAGLNVSFAGFQEEPSRFYRSSDVFVNPTLGPEGMPLVSLEAMSYGLPCIFSDVDVHREITDNGKAAMLFRSGESVDLMSKLELLLTSVALPTLYGKLAREAILARHTSQIARSRYIQEIQL